MKTEKKMRMEKKINKTKSTTMFDTTLNESSVRFSNADGVSTFIISVSKEDYTSMIIHKKYRRAEKNRDLCLHENIPYYNLDYGNISLVKKYGKLQKYLVDLILNAINYRIMENSDMHVAHVNVDL